MRLRLLSLVAAMLALTTTLVSCGGGSSSSSNVVHAQEVVVQQPAAGPSPSATPVDAATALALLKEGNQRYVNGTNMCYVRTEDRPMNLDSMQAPIAVVIGCSDSRVDPLLAFDQPWGQLFVGRLAGNVIDTNVLGSTEYAVRFLQTKLIVVMGHQKCGAVDAALKGTPVGGDLQSLIDMIQPAVQASAGQPGDPLLNAIIANIRLCVGQVKADPTINFAINNAGVQVVGALYTFETGLVIFEP